MHFVSVSLFFRRRLRTCEGLQQGHVTTGTCAGCRRHSRAGYTGARAGEGWDGELHCSRAQCIACEMKQQNLKSSISHGRNAPCPQNLLAQALHHTGG
jgi:hypothetical protein